ncbi:MAG: hypothetical protein NZ992_01930 [Candidatus Korarchaeum sp.]|nr:hypothetical protein [Candidatus Korarchaeum sp.]MDW8035804.1 hypothetical protein [Candidatus Korarchaeum sp.]
MRERGSLITSPTYRSDELLIVAPFSKQGASLLEGVTLEDLAEDPSLEEVRSLARERLLAAVLGSRFHSTKSPALEVYSFVAAKLIAAGAGRSVLSRLADYEAKRFLRLCQRLSLEQLKEIASSTFGISTKGEIWMDLASYLKGASRIGGRKWRLVNRVVAKGYVLVDRYELERIIAEHVRESVLRAPKVELPPPLVGIAEEASKLLAERTPRGAEVKGELPPCISELLERVREGDNLTHQSRFALVAHLLERGWKEDQIVELFRSLPDFKERVTAYQVSHIAKRKYKPPSCDTMRDWGLCNTECKRRKG